MVIYAFVVCICIYGLSVSESIFVDLNNTLCSILKFVNEVIDGETKPTLPKWGGAATIQNILSDVGKTIKNLDSQMVTDLQNSDHNIVNKKTDFLSELNSRAATIQSEHTEGGNQLDILKRFGSNSAVEPEKLNLKDKWTLEYTYTSGELHNMRTIISDNFGKIKDKKDDFSTSITNAASQIDDLRSSFEEIKGDLAEALIDISGYIEKYGKLAIKIVFSILMIINLAIAAFMTIQIFCRISECNNCFFKCILKSLVHILWNILTFLTILTLLIGGILTLIGEAGKDFIYVFKYLVSDENIKSSEPTLIEGDVGNYLGVCINGDGNITSSLSINLDSVNYIDQLRTTASNFTSAREQILNLRDNKVSYDEYKSEFENIVNYNEDFFVLTSSGGKKFSQIINAANNKISSTSDQIKFSKININEDCYPCHEPSFYGYNSLSSSDSDINLLNYAINLIITAKTGNKGTSPSVTPIPTILTNVADKYDNYLEAEADSLDVYNNTISGLIYVFDKYAGNGTAFSILNCKFIGKNIKILLKYLDKSLGKSFYTIGICLDVAGFTMLFSISFTILLHIILQIKENVPQVQVVDNIPQPNYGEGVARTDALNINYPHMITTN
jgi:hypothetical protein